MFKLPAYRSTSLAWLLCLLAGAVNAAEPVAVPAELQGWQDWVLRGQEQMRCPRTFSAAGAPTSDVSCAWPLPLALSVDAHGGRFNQDWDVYAESWIALPGDEQHWPRDVRVNNGPGAVVAHDGRPQLHLGPGHYAVAGVFQWSSRPQQLMIPTQTGILKLSVDGQAVAQPERPGEAVSFGKTHSTAQATSMDLQVYRLVNDDIPVSLTTRLRLQVAGEAREEVLARALPDGFVPVSLTGALPARLDADGQLHVQVRAGNFDLTLVARGASVASALHRPPLPAASGGHWAREEVWSFQGNDRLRIASVEGAEGIDPAQANVPSEWRALPAFRMSGDTTLNITERSRGLATTDENRLTLARHLWLDFDHAGYTAVDSIGGQMRQEWRLDMQAPYRLESARSGEDHLLVTQGADATRTGIEVRTPAVAIRTVSRLDGNHAGSAATGWATRFEHVSGVLELPVGHRLLGIVGPDTVSGTWWSRWGLWSLFGVILVTVFTYRIVGAAAAAVALGALVLMYQEQPSSIWLWANALAAIGLTAVVPQGRLRRFLRGYRIVALALLGMTLLPLLFGQIRLAIYPQLEALGYGYGLLAGSAGAMSDQSQGHAVTLAMPPPPPAPAAAAPPAEPAPAADELALKEEVDANAPASSSDATTVASAVASRMASVAKSSAPPAILQSAQRYAPGTQIQTGPGIPSWQYRSYSYGWSGPVDADAKARFIFIGPLVLAVWRLIGVVLLGIWFFALLLRAFDLRVTGHVAPLARWLASGRPGGGAAAMLLLVGVTAGMVVTPPARAASTPDQAMLNDLRSRLTAPPLCAPDCADITHATVKVSGDRLDVELSISALAFAAVAVPSADNRWQVESLSVDGAGSLAVRRTGDGNLWVPLRPGAGLVRMSGRITTSDNLQLAFPQRPRTIDVSAAGWDVAGVNEGRLISGSLELARRQGGAGSGSAATGGALGLDGAATGAQFPAFVRVVRNINLDLDWTVNSVVERVAPERTAMTVEVPLLAGESVLTEGIKLRDGNVALIGLGSGESEHSWQSALAHADNLTLTMPAESARAEVWNFSVNPQWRVTFSGMPAVLPDDSDAAAWVFSYYPRPGETLHVAVSRPAAVVGRTLAIDSVEHERTVGERTSDESLEFSYRSTQGGRHAISLPVNARVASVQLDGQEAQLRPEKGELSIGLLPGEHRVTIRWQSPQGAGLFTTTDGIDLHSPASNIQSTLQLPEDRWPLFALGRGAGVGPAILYWGELVALILTALLLGRQSWSPIKTHEWLLLGLGLSTLSWSVLVLVAVWLFAMRWRSRWQGASQALSFNLVQILLAALTVAAVGSLLFSGIEYGFLSNPSMGVVGQGSGGNTFAWFRDQSTSTLPAPVVFSVPLWIYKSLIFAWALWIASALVRWLKMAWTSWSSGGFWGSRLPPAVLPATESTSAPDPTSLP